MRKHKNGAKNRSVAEGDFGVKRYLSLPYSFGSVCFVPYSFTDPRKTSALNEVFSNLVLLRLSRSESMSVKEYGTKKHTVPFKTF